jgi:hypothetical protein
MRSGLEPQYGRSRLRNFSRTVVILLVGSAAESASRKKFDKHERIKMLASARILVKQELRVDIEVQGTN